MDKSLRQSIVIALLVAGALFMEQLDGTVIATALPQMAQSFRHANYNVDFCHSPFFDFCNRIGPLLPSTETAVCPQL